jgi:adenylate cyclase
MNNYFKKRINLFLGLSIGFIIALLISFANIFSLFDSFELNTVDWRFKTLQEFRQKPDDRIVIIGVDDFDIEKIGKWPWKRENHAKIVNFLRLYGAKAVIFDIFFLGKDLEHPESDARFADSIKKAGNVYMAGKIIPIENNYKQDLSIQSKRKMQDNSITNYFDIIPENAKNIIPKEKQVGFQLPFFGLENAAKKYGTVFAGESDDFNNTRYQNLVYKQGNDLYTSLTLGFAKDFLLEKHLLNKKIKIPVDEKNHLIVNWLPNKSDFSRPYMQYSAWKFIESYDNLLKASKACGVSPEKFKQIYDSLYYCNEKGKNCPQELNKYLEKIPEDFELKFNGHNPTDLFKDKIIFFGAASTSTTVRDQISTPFVKDIPGVYLQANVVDNLINKNFLHKETKAATVIVIFILAMLTGISIFGIKNSLSGIVCSVALNIIYLFIAVFAFAKYNWWLDIIYTELAIILTFSVSYAVYYIMEGKEKIKIKKAMSNYISPQIMDEVLSDPTKLNLGGTKKELTILFSDVRGFTTLSENAEPEEVVKMLNEYFTAMVEVIFRNNGTVDKFIGDAIMAFWNAPLSIEDHAYFAVKTAVEMLEDLEKLKEKWAKENKSGINIGIGINTAEVTIGNIGSEKIKDYTIIGDGVNTASRLESITKEYKTKIIISETTYEKVKNKIIANYLGESKLKGKDKLIKVYEVLGLVK